MLTDSEQSVLRIYANHALIDLCDIYRVSRTSDGAGGSLISEQLAQSNVKCRISPVRNDFEQEAVISERIGAEVTWILSLPYGTDIRLTDRVKTGTTEFEVKAVLGEPRSIATVIRTIVSEIK